MMSKWVTLLAAAAGLISSASACGWRHENCCNVQYNNPNIGVCHDARTVCWEGKCMDCGTNGKKACDSVLLSSVATHVIARATYL